MNKFVVGSVGLFLLGASPVFANSLTDFSSQPEVQTHNGIPYVSGGIGLDERAELRALSKTDNLKLSFALQNKEYIGGAEVTIKDSNGREILETASEGPLFFTKLPAGIYTVEATAMGETLDRTVHVPSEGQAQVYFAWKESKGEPQSQAMANQ
jgi:hypothetical protein